MKRLAGRTFDDPEVQEVEKNFIMAELADANGQAGVKVIIARLIISREGSEGRFKVLGGGGFGADVTHVGCSRIEINAFHLGQLSR